MRQGAKRILLSVAVASLLAVATVLGVVLSSRLPADATLTGQVTAIKGPIPFSLPGLSRVRVVAEPGGYATRTNGKGRFALKVPPGVYQVTFTKKGYETLTEKVVVPAAAPASMLLALDPTPTGPPVAAWKPSDSKSADGAIAYNTSVYLDASESKNISRQQMRWEIRDEAGQVLMDPYAVPTRPLQLEPSPIPGSSPLSFTFAPPKPGRFTVRLFLKNAFSPDRESQAQVIVEAKNRPPILIAGVAPGPGASGYTLVAPGERVYLTAWVLDRNMPSPELYNPGGRQPDAYGKNDDRLQRQFSFNWRLMRLEGGKVTDETANLEAPAGQPAANAQYPSFVATKPGRYMAMLTVADRDPYGSLTAETTVSVNVVAKAKISASDSTCTQSGCHTSAATKSQGGKLAGMACQDCHGPAQPHLAVKDPKAKPGTIGVSYAAAQCGRCHDEYAEWEKSRHSDGYPFGYNEIAQPLLLNCAKCHYPKGFADAIATVQAKKVSFGKVEFKKPMFPGGPLFFDFDKLPDKVGDGVSCQACHDPHQISKENRVGLRAPTSMLCGTCHEAKWQNVLLEGTAGRVGSAYEYPGEKYGFKNPHDSEEKCVLCHMSQAVATTDQTGTRRLGGHTLRMRDAGPDGKLGGFGPSPDDPNRLRETSGADDTLNLAVCRKCHAGADTFNLKGRQEEIYALWTRLGQLLRERNNGVLPGYKPGDKCATCHRGGTLPFDDDPRLVLENAYTNYKLVGNDRSWGIHNYKYTRKLLEDSIRSLQSASSN